MEFPSPSPLYHWTFRRVAWATLVLVFVAFSFYLLYRFNQVVFTVFFAIVMATVIRPAVNWFYRHGLPRTAGVLLVYFLLLALLTGFVVLLFPLIVDQGAAVTAALPGYYLSLRQWVAGNSNPLIASFGQFLPAAMPGLALGLPSEQQTGQQVLDSAGQAMGYAAAVGNAVFTILAFVLLVFHWTLDGPRTIQSWLNLIPKAQRDNIGELVLAMESKVGSYLAGQGVLCVAIGAMALVAYVLIGLPNALVLALVAGVLEAVPMVGPLLGAIPAAAVALSVSPTKLIWVVAATLVIQQLENSLLVPRIMRKAVGVNPFVSLLAIFAFSSLFGIAGALMAIPLAAILQLLLDRFVFQTAAPEPEAAGGRDFASRLRYEAQDLAQDLRKQARLKKGGSALQVKQVDHVLDEIEAITTDLDALLAQTQPPEVP